MDDDDDDGDYGRHAQAPRLLQNQKTTSWWSPVSVCKHVESVGRVLTAPVGICVRMSVCWRQRRHDFDECSR